MATLKTRITRLLPGYSLGTNVTVNQLVARLNSSRTHAQVANATVRGRLSELVASGAVATETRSSGRTGYFLSA